MLIKSTNNISSHFLLHWKKKILFHANIEERITEPMLILLEKSHQKLFGENESFAQNNFTIAVDQNMRKM